MLDVPFTLSLTENFKDNNFGSQVSPPTRSISLSGRYARAIKNKFCWHLNKFGHAKRQMRPPPSLTPSRKNAFSRIWKKRVMYRWTDAQWVETE